MPILILEKADKSFILGTASTHNVDITVGDASNDTFHPASGGVHNNAADDLKAAGIILQSSDTILRFSNDAIVGDVVTVTCFFADATNTKFMIHGNASS